MSTTTLPAQRAAERAYGAFADAFGLRWLRDGMNTCQALAAAQVGELAAQAGYLQIVAEACGDGLLMRMPARLVEQTANGQPVRTPLALLRLSAAEVDAAMHDAMLSDRGLAATATAVRARSRRRLETRRLTELGREALGGPTRAELDGMHQEIHELKRELRKLRQAQADPETAR